MVLDNAAAHTILTTLGSANHRFRKHFPGEPSTRQPVHTVYGGAQLFKATTPKRLGELALAFLQKYAPSAEALGEALQLPNGASFHRQIYDRTVSKLKREPVEDFRIDFEDGFGSRPDAEEDEVACFTAGEVVRAKGEGLLPPFIGIRVKPLTEELKARSVRTLDLFVSTLVKQGGTSLPDNFVITLPKVVIPEQVSAFCSLLELLERAHGLQEGSLKIELMIEITQALFDHEGRSTLPQLLRAAQGRCVAAHFGTYDYTASANITAAHQAMDHPACDFAKAMMMNTFAGTGIFLSDGATNVMPTGPHRGSSLTATQEAENREVVVRAWRLAYRHTQHSLRGGFYQGWDLHPGQLVVRYAACYAFFLEGAEAAGKRLTNFIDQAAQATLVGDVFDDAATGQGLLNYFLRALNCGALEIGDLLATGLTLEEIQGRSFVKILANRRKS